MKRQKAAATLHPNLGTLALYSSAELRWTDRWRTGHHVAQCTDCQQHVLSFRSAKAELKQEANAQTLTGFESIADWSHLEREMLGNIAVGVAAARCIDHVGRGRAVLSWGAVITGLAILFVIGWMTHVPKEQTDHLTDSLRRLVGLEGPQATGTVLRTTPDGIVVRAQGATLTIMHPRKAVVSLSGSSAVAARYVDEETGEVTITKVYGQ
jgi:hypothetical protein